MSFYLDRNPILGIYYVYYMKEHRQSLYTNMLVTKDMIIGDVLDKYPDVAEYFFAIGMHCLGCPHSRGESIEEACMVHGANCADLLKKINDHIQAK